MPHGKNKGSTHKMSGIRVDKRSTRRYGKSFDLDRQLSAASRFGADKRFDREQFGIQVIVKDDDGYPRCYLLRDPSLLIGGDWVRDRLGLIDPSQRSNLTTRGDEAWRGHMTDAAWMPRTRMRKFSPDILHVEIVNSNEIEEFERTWTHHETRPVAD